jgi:hypothetical protein
MNAEPAAVDRTSPSRKLRSNCTAGETSEPKVTVATKHLGGAIFVVDVVSVAAVEVMTEVVVPVAAVMLAVVVAGMTVNIALTDCPVLPNTRIV